MNALKQLVQQGKIKYIDLSECSTDTIRRAYAIHQISDVQIEYSQFSLDIEKEEIGLLKTCQELVISIVCYSPLGRGVINGQYKSPNDFRRHLTRFSKKNFPKNLQLVEILKSFADKKRLYNRSINISLDISARRISFCYSRYN
jgi:aryl-alcohol dehydrogenase-like predicted oxidoreductase